MTAEFQSPGTLDWEALFWHASCKTERLKERKRKMNGRILRMIPSDPVATSVSSSLLPWAVGNRNFSCWLSLRSLLAYSSSMIRVTELCSTDTRSLILWMISKRLTSSGLGEWLCWIWFEPFHAPESRATYITTRQPLLFRVQRKLLRLFFADVEKRS